MGGKASRWLAVDRARHGLDGRWRGNRHRRLRLCRGLRVTLWGLLLIPLMNGIGCHYCACNFRPRLAPRSRLGALLHRSLRVTLWSRLWLCVLRLLWLCVLRLLWRLRVTLRRLLLGRLGIPLRSLLACKGAILCLGQGRNTAGQARLLVAGINWLQVKPNVELNARLAVVVQLVLACVKCSICLL